MARLGWLRQPYYTLNQMHLEILILGQQNKKTGIMCNRFKEKYKRILALKIYKHNK